MDAHTLSFSYNGIFKGIALHDLPSEPLYPAVCLYYTQACVTFIPAPTIVKTQSSIPAVLQTDGAINLYWHLITNILQRALDVNSDSLSLLVDKMKTTTSVSSVNEAVSFAQLLEIMDLSSLDSNDSDRQCQACRDYYTIGWSL